VSKETEQTALRLHAAVLLTQSDAEYSLGLAVSDLETLRRAERFSREAEAAYADLGDGFNVAKAQYNRAGAVVARAKIVYDADVLRDAASLYAVAAGALRGQGDQGLYARALLTQANALADAAIALAPVEAGTRQAVETLLCEAEEAFASTGDPIGLAEVQLARGVNPLRFILGASLFGVVALDKLADRVMTSGSLDHIVAASAALDEAAEVLVRGRAFPAAGQAFLAQGLSVFVVALVSDDAGAVRRCARLFEMAAENFRKAGRRRDEALAISMQSSALMDLAPRLRDPDLFRAVVAQSRAALSLVHDSDVHTIAGLRLLEARAIGECAMVSQDVEEWRSALIAIDAAIARFSSADATFKASLLHSRGGILAKIAAADDDAEMFLAAARAFEGAQTTSTDVRLTTSSFVYQGIALVSAAFLSGERLEMNKAVAVLEAAVEHCRQSGDLEHLALGQMTLSCASAELAVQDKDAPGFARATSMLEDTAERFEALGQQDGANEARTVASQLPTEWSARVGDDALLSADEGGT